MAPTINNERAEELAGELAGLTGMSATEAIIMALEKELDRRRNRIDFGAAIRSLSEEFAKYPVLDDRNTDEILYDENGLPH